MERYLFSQVFVGVVAALLLVTFFILVAVSAVAGAEIFTPLILIVLSIVALGIFSELIRLENMLESKKGGKK